jgi:integrase
VSPRLTDAIVKRLEPPAAGNVITYDGNEDNSVAGFGARITAAGARAFILDYRTKAGRKRRITIGSFPSWTTVGARDRAKELKRLVDQGHDPLGDIEAEREAPTVAALIERFEAEHLPRKRPGTAADYKRMIKNHIAPHFGKSVKVADVTHDQVQQLHDRITKRGHLHRANRTIAVLSKMFSLAMRWNMRTDNPVRGLERHYEAKRKRYVNGDELQRLIEALNQYPEQSTADIFRLLLLTGARRGEVLSMRWADVDLTAGKWIKPGSTTKQKTDHEVPLAAPVRLLLSNIRQRQTGNRPLGEYVFPGNGEAGHVVAVKKAWASICKSAEISGLRIHDLRHSFASHLASMPGSSLPLIGSLLGHSNPSTTARYSHLFDDPQKMAVEAVAKAMAVIGPQPAEPAQEVTPIRRGR